MPGEIHNRGTCDSMTGLWDRMTFFADANKGIGENGCSNLILVQLSQLMRVNRKYGVAVGDQLLRDVAEYLKTVDPEYSAYRIANSRMALLGPKRTGEQDRAVAAKIRNRFREKWPVILEGAAIEVTAKAQVVYFTLEQKDTENDILDKMNYALSVFGREAEDWVLFYDEKLNEEMLERRRILEEVRYAIEHKTFRMYYQPIYDCREKRFTSAESLIRLFDRNGDFVSPGKFIPMAEEDGLIDSISWVVLEKVCQFLGEHPELPIKTISVNMTGQQIADDTFSSRIQENLEKYHVDGSRLRIEITERMVTDDIDEVRRVMEQLAEKGIHFYLDDFGTGYSNLASMLQLPFEVIKFDKTLIEMMDGLDKGRRTIGLLSDIMHENDYKIVAEGVETELQVKLAYERKLDRIQGYYYAKPMPEEELIAFLEKEAGRAEA